MAVKTETSITIYRLVKLDHLQNNVQDGYYMKTLEREIISLK